MAINDVMSLTGSPDSCLIYKSEIDEVIKRENDVTIILFCYVEERFQFSRKASDGN